MTQQDLQCPFCEKSSPKPQGLSAHIRNRHVKQYPKWLKIPDRFQFTAKAAVEPEPAADAPEAAIERPAMAAPPAQTPDPTLQLLSQAHDQLAARKQGIEAELARFADLTRELELVNGQLASLDKTLEVFRPV